MPVCIGGGTATQTPHVCTWLSGEIVAFTLWSVTPDYRYMFPSLCVARCKYAWCPRERERVTGRHRRRFGGWWQRRDLWWRPPFCQWWLTQITPSAIFLLCMLMKQRAGVMRKEWQIKKWVGEYRKRNRKQCVEEYMRELRELETWPKVFVKRSHRKGGHMCERTQRKREIKNIECGG